MNNRHLLGFELTKWYLDVVAADGSALVGYHARLRWHGMRLHYAGLLQADAAAAVRSSWSVRTSARPRFGSGRVRWACAAVGLRGEWLAEEPGYGRRLHATDEGAVTWECVAPRARAAVLVAGQRMRGTGYVERMRLTLLPWRLPLDRLYWGRFHAPGHTVTWIIWQGARPLTCAWHNGELDCAVKLRDHELLLPRARARLILQPVRTLRDASVLGTVLDALPALTPVVPPGFRAREHKHVSHGILESDGAQPLRGWALHEEVTWR